MKSSTSEGFWKSYAALPKEMRRDETAGERGICSVREAPVLSEPSLQAGSLDTTYLFGPDKYRLPGGRYRRGRRDHVVLDRVTRRLRQPPETTEKRITTASAGRE